MKTMISKTSADGGWLNRLVTRFFSPFFYPFLSDSRHLQCSLFGCHGRPPGRRRLFLLHVVGIVTAGWTFHFSSSHMDLIFWEGSSTNHNPGGSGVNERSTAFSRISTMGFVFIWLFSEVFDFLVHRGKACCDVFQNLHDQIGVNRKIDFFQPVACKRVGFVVPVFGNDIGSCFPFSGNLRLHEVFVDFEDLFFVRFHDSKLRSTCAHVNNYFQLFFERENSGSFSPCNAKISHGRD